ncbi:MAG: DUF805 domain-containing protein [Clostridiales bacterium]|nr:DUF805 domain-containing protein [Clostridiales bacterium]MBR5417456.1 DUF805 domain-containing protein [Clostridiales bacterium]
MLLFFLFMLCQLITLEDLAEYWQEMLNIKNGTLTRCQYFACTWLSSIVISIFGSVFLANIGLKYNGLSGNLEYWLAYGTLYLIITFIQLSAFMRRMNDADLSRWYALVFLIPGIGNIVAVLIALMPTGFGSPY